MYCAKTAAARRYRARTLFATTAYLLAIWGVTWIFRHRHPQGAAVYLLALAPELPIFAILAIFGIYLAEEKDEFIRAVLVQSSLWATCVVLAFTTFWSLLQIYAPAIDLVVKVPMYWVFALWCVSFALAQPLVQLRYK
jgi:hypothetical protein